MGYSMVFRASARSMGVMCCARRRRVVCSVRGGWPRSKHGAHPSAGTDVVSSAIVKVLEREEGPPSKAKEEGECYR